MNSMRPNELHTWHGTLKTVAKGRRRSSADNDTAGATGGNFVASTAAGDDATCGASMMVLIVCEP